MKTAIYIIAGLFALAGAWFAFYKIGYKVGFHRMNNYYCDNLIKIFTLKDMDELFTIWEGTEKTEPCIIVKPEKWKNFKQ